VCDAVALPTVMQCGIGPNQAHAKQLLRFVDHMTRPINLERGGPKVSVSTAQEHNATMLRYARYLVSVRGANREEISIEHVLEKDFAVELDNWLDCSRGAPTSSRRKHIALVLDCDICTCSVSDIVPGYEAVPEAYRRWVNQLRQNEAQEVKTQTDLIRENQWLPFPVLMELPASGCIECQKAVANGTSE
jgi:transposase-like protein